MSEQEVKDLYFEWLCGLVYDPTYLRRLSYASLLRHLNSVPFQYTHPRDVNREADGLEMRYRFAYSNDIPYPVVATYLDTVPCSILEMMVALALNIEEEIMGNPSKGDRIGQWFWEMIVSLGLGSQNDSRFDPSYVDQVIERFENHQYKPDGEGGLFTIPNCVHDLRKAEIWYQMNWYLLTIGD